MKRELLNKDGSPMREELLMEDTKTELVFICKLDLETL